MKALERLAAGLASRWREPCRLRREPVDASFAYDALRRQYHSTAILASLDRTVAEAESRVLGVTALDLFVPIFTFVFGEAQICGRCAVVSTYRLRQEFYGLPTNPVLTEERLLKESVHELGHTYGLRHCHNWRCVMASSHAVDRVDLKSAELCAACRAGISDSTRGLYPRSSF